MKITVAAIGKARGVEAEWCAEYQKRLGSSVSICEYPSPKALQDSEAQKAEAHLLLRGISPKSYVVVLDEKGADLTSKEFAAKISAWQDQGLSELVFIIGGAAGVTKSVQDRSNFTLRFGSLTWPHRLVRVMLLEQIYRAKQIIAGHPYHRE